MTEMTCVSPEGRITPGCPGLWNDEQRDAWAAGRRLRARRSTTARIGLQLGHSGRKGSTKLMWEGMDEPLDDGNWEVVGPSPLPYGEGCHVPRESHSRGHGRGGRRVRGCRPPRRSRPASTCSSCTPPTATCCPRSCRRSPTSAPTSTAVRWRTGCGSRSRSSTRSAPRSRPTDPGDRPHLRDRLDAGRQHRGRRRRDRPRLHRPRRRRDRRLVRAGRPRTRSRRSAARTRPRSPTGSATRSPTRPASP